MNVVVVTYWWGDGVCKNSRKNYLTQNMSARPLRYSQMVARLSKQAERHGLLFDSEKIDSSNYQHSISYKAEFIEKMLHKWKRPVLYLDCDMQIHKPPIIFQEGVYDFMAFNWNADPRVSVYSPVLFDWNTLETSGGMMYFNNTPSAFKLLHAWKQLLKLNPNKADDRLLSMAFKRTDAKRYLTYYWVPMEYFFIPQFYHQIVPRKQVVISHSYALTDEDDAKKMAGTKNRVPKDYHRTVSKHAKHHTSFCEDSLPEHVRHAVRHRNKAMKTHGIAYSIKA